MHKGETRTHGHIDSTYTTVQAGQTKSDYDKLFHAVSDYQYTGDLSDAIHVVLDNGVDGYPLMSEEELDSFTAAHASAKAEGFKDHDNSEAEWTLDYLDAHFEEKTSLKETREQSYAHDDDPTAAGAREELAAAQATNTGALGEALLKGALDAQEFKPLGVDTNADGTIDADEAELLKQRIADRVRWGEQCYLAHYVESLANLRKAYKRDYRFVNVINGKPSHFMNRLFHKPNSGPFVNIKTDQASELTPLFRLWKVVHRWEEEADGSASSEFVTEVPIIFEELARNDLLSPTAGITPGVDAEGKEISTPAKEIPAVGYGWTKFEWKYIGSNPETVRNDIQANLTLTFQDFNQLTRVRTYNIPGTEDTHEWRLIDLLGYGTDSALESENRPDEFHEKFFEIKVEAGWNDVKFSHEDKVMEESVKNQKTTLFLTLVDHEFEINDIGTFNLHLSYRARLDALLTDPKVDILANKEYRAQLAEIEKLMTNAKKACDKEGQENAKTLYREQIELHRRTNLHKFITDLSNADDNRGSPGLSPANGIGSADDRQPHWQVAGHKTDATGHPANRIYIARPSVGELASFANGTLPSYPLDTGASGAGPAPSSDQTVDDFLKLLISEDDAVDADNPLEALLNVANPEVDVDTSGDTARVKVPFFYFGDLVELATAYALDSDAFLEIGEIGALASDEADNIKVILGPYEFFNGVESVTINMADIPISVRAFSDFWYKNVVAAGKDKYLLLHFVRDAIEQLIIKAMGADCFAFTGHPLGSKPVRLRTGFLTLPPKAKSSGASDAKLQDPLLNLPSGAYEDDPAIGAPGTIKLEEINILKDSIFSSETAKELTQDIPESENTLRQASDSIYNVTEMHHYLVVYAESAEPWDLEGNALEDEKKGIFHLYFHRGIMHQASFKKTDQPYLREARYENTRYNPLVHLSNVYDVGIETLGNTLFYPGTYVFINPIGLGTSLGSPVAQRSISNIMGLGGYHFIIDVTNRIGKTFTTSIGARWDNNGSGTPRSRADRSPETEDSPCADSP